jgi:hypothetical protein
MLKPNKCYGTHGTHEYQTIKTSNNMHHVYKLRNIYSRTTIIEHCTILFSEHSHRSGQKLH